MANSQADEASCKTISTAPGFSFSWHQIIDQFQMFFSDTCADPWLDSSKDEALQGGKVTVAL